MTHLDTLPEALAGDAGKLMLEQQMAYNQYPPVHEREGVAGLWKASNQY
jgi:hypothetical protein